MTLRVIVCIGLMMFSGNLNAAEHLSSEETERYNMYRSLLHVLEMYSSINAFIDTMALELAYQSPDNGMALYNSIVVFSQAMQKQGELPNIIEQRPMLFNRVPTIKDIFTFFECPICLGDTARPVGCVLSCGHAFGKECIAGVVDLSLKEKNLQHLVCPSCPISATTQKRRELDAEDIRKIVSKDRYADIIDRLNKIREREFLRASGAKPCPGTDCEGFLIEEERAGLSSCIGGTCNDLYCARCPTPHATSISCKQAQAHQAMSTGMQELLKTGDFKLCPGCGEGIQKTAGCRHMKCRCNHQFCWVCERPCRSLGAPGHERCTDIFHAQEKKGSQNALQVIIDLWSKACDRRRQYPDAEVYNDALKEIRYQAEVNIFGHCRDQSLDRLIYGGLDEKIQVQEFDAVFKYQYNRVIQNRNIRDMYGRKYGI